MAYNRTTTINAAPGGDSVKQAILDLDTDLTGAFSGLNTHEGLTATHGATGAVVGTTNTQTLTNKTLTSPKINEDVALTATATELNVLDGITASTAELNLLHGVTASTTELNYVDGVTSAIQDQINGKAASDHNHTGVYAPVLGADDNYVTDAEKTKLSNLSGTNTGDQDLSGKQDVLVSGTNIKTVNSTSLLGSGDITISGGGGGYPPNRLRWPC